MADDRKKRRAVSIRGPAVRFRGGGSEPMKYMLLTYLDEKAWLSLSPAEQQRQMAECGPHVAKLVAAKKILAGAPLHPTSTATTIRYQEGKRLLTDGPFAETREQLGGYTIIDARDLDEALA